MPIAVRNCGVLVIAMLFGTLSCHQLLIASVSPHICVFRCRFAGSVLSLDARIVVHFVTCFAVMAFHVVVRSDLVEVRVRDRRALEHDFTVLAIFGNTATFDSAVTKWDSSPAHESDIIVNVRTKDIQQALQMRTMRSNKSKRVYVCVGVSHYVARRAGAS